MTDQTKWGIPEVQQKNKQKAYQEQTEMRDDLAFFVLNCSVYELQEMHKEMRRLRKNEKNTGGGATTTIEGASSGSRSTCISVPNQGYFADNNDSTPFNISFNGLLDSPSTTSAVTYTMVVKTPSATFNLNYNKTVADTDNASHERGLSWITVMEVAG